MDGFSIDGPHSIQDLSKVPSLPGLYAWYARFKVEEADWNSAYTEGNEAARNHLLKALFDHSLKYGRQEMPIRAESNFSSIWKGTLREEQGSRWQEKKVTPVTDNTFSFRMLPSLQNDLTRYSLISLLDNAFPLFGSPLYVGKATDQTLRERLRRHSSDYLRLWKLYLKDRQFADRLATPKNFAERAIKIGFCPDDLYCITISIDVTKIDGIDNDDAFVVIEAAEWLLNRWATPLLGRQ